MSRSSSSSLDKDESSSTVAQATLSPIMQATLDRMRAKAKTSTHDASPTSIVTIPLTPPNVQSRVILNTLAEQQGTEVALLDISQDDTIIIPRRCFADEVEDVDDEHDNFSVMTPLRKTRSHAKSSQVLASPTTPAKISLCGMGAPCWKPSDTLTPVKTASNNNHLGSLPVQDYILALLGDDKDTVTFWRQHLSCFPSSVKDAVELEKERQQRTLLKRKPHQIKAQRRHLEDLRHNLHPFGTSPQRVNLCRTSSHQPFQSRSASKLKKPLGTIPPNEPPSSLWNVALACHNPHVVQAEESFEVSFDGYDSDPECFGRTPLARSPPRQPATPKHLFPIDIVGNENSLLEEAKSILNERWTLILHRPKKRPQAFHVWIERGQRLQKTVLSPRLAWKPIPKKAGLAHLESSPASSIDVLDLQRILPLNEIDRSQYPLAKTGNCLLLKSTGGEFCWQAASAHERDRLILLWKIMVARFGSLLVTGDVEGMEEYFAPLEASVRSL